MVAVVAVVAAEAAVVVVTRDMKKHLFPVDVSDIISSHKATNIIRCVNDESMKCPLYTH